MRAYVLPDWIAGELSTHPVSYLISQPVFSFVSTQQNEICSSCEFLRKLDLTLNFIDFDELAGSVEHLAQLPHLHDLFMMGNPAAQVRGKGVCACGTA